MTNVFNLVTIRFLKTKTQLEEYFDKKRKVFDLPIYFTGTDSQPLEKRLAKVLRIFWSV